MGQTVSNKFLDPFGFGRTGYEKSHSSFEPFPENLQSLRVAVTGANSGLGFATTKKLAELGAKVYMLCRDKTRGEEAKSQIQGDVTLLQLDIENYESIINFEMPEVDVLIHNAGAMFDKRE